MCVTLSAIKLIGLLAEYGGICKMFLNILNLIYSRMGRNNSFDIISKTSTVAQA